MAKINLDLSAAKSESSSMFSVLPDGKYTVVLAHSEFKKTTSGFGLTLGFMVEEGPHTGKMTRDFVNVKNSSAQAEEIGMSRVKKIMEVQGRTKFVLVDDTDLISPTKFTIEVTEEESEFFDKNDKKVVAKQNRIKKILEIEGAVVQKESSPKSKPAAVEAPPVTTAAKTMPWDK